MKKKSCSRSIWKRPPRSIWKNAASPRCSQSAQYRAQAQRKRRLQLESETSSGGSENPGYTQLRGLGKNKRKQPKEARMKDVTMYLWSSHCKCVGRRVVENRLQPL